MRAVSPVSKGQRTATHLLPASKRASKIHKHQVSFTHLAARRLASRTPQLASSLRSLPGTLHPLRADLRMLLVPRRHYVAFVLLLALMLTAVVLGDASLSLSCPLQHPPRRSFSSTDALKGTIAISIAGDMLRTRAARRWCCTRRSRSSAGACRRRSTR